MMPYMKPYIQFIYDYISPTLEGDKHVRTERRYPRAAEPERRIIGSLRERKTRSEEPRDFSNDTYEYRYR